MRSLITAAIAAAVVFVLSPACTRRAAEPPADQSSTTTAAQTAAPAEVPPPDPATWSQNIKPILAGGVVEAEGLEDWPVERRLKKASEVFKNLKLLGDDRADTFMASMQSMKPALGMGCKACHVKDDWASDEKKDKKEAREMIEMAASINGKHFEDRIAVSCFTCHHGEDHPEKNIPADAKRAEPKTPVKPLSPADAARPAEEVYANIEVLKGFKAGDVMKVMESFNAALGVECEHCHAPNGDWKDEGKAAKKTTRQMMAMSAEIDRENFGGEGEVTCWTCHRGMAEPLLRAEAP